MLVSCTVWRMVRIERWIRDQGPQAIAWAQRAMAARPDRTHVLAGYEGPATVVVGEEDEVTPFAQAEAMHAVLRDGALVVVPGAGHMTSNESPEPVASALTTLVSATVGGPLIKVAAFSYAVRRAFPRGSTVTGSSLPV